MVYAPDESPSQPQQDPPNSMVFYGSAVAIVVFSAVSSLAGVSKGTHRLSEFDMLLALLFLVFTGKSLFLLNALVLSTLIPRFSATPTIMPPLVSGPPGVPSAAHLPEISLPSPPSTLPTARSAHPARRSRAMKNIDEWSSHTEEADPPSALKQSQELLAKITITEIAYHETLHPRGHGACRYRHADVPACLGAAG